MRRLLLCCLALSLAGCSTAEVRGYVRDAETNEPLPGAKLVVDGETITTDREGFYSVQLEHPHDMHVVEIERADYVPRRAYFAVVEGVDSVNRDIYMYPEAPGDEQGPR